MMERSTLSGFFSVISTKVVRLGVGLVGTPILVRLLSKSQYGEFAFLMSLFGIFMIVVSSGVGDGVRKFVAEERDADDWKRHVVGFYYQLALAMALVGAAVLALGGYFLAGNLFGRQFRLYFYILSVLVILAQLRTVTRSALMGFGLEKFSEPLKVFNRVAYYAIALPLVYLGWGVPGVLTGFVVANLLITLVGLLYLGRRISLQALLDWTPSRFPRRQFLEYNVLSIVLMLLLNSLYHVDILLLQPMVGSVTTSNYKVALTFAEFLWFVPTAIQMTLLHSTSNMWSNDRNDTITRLSSRVTRYTALLVGLMAVGLAALADIAVPLYFSEKYSPAVTPLLLLLPGAVGFALARPLLAIGQGKGDLWVPIGATGVAAAINVGLNLLLIPRFEMNGAAVATSIGYGSMFLFHLAGARMLGFDPLEELRPVRVLATITVTGVFVYVLSAVITDDLVALLVVPPAGAIAFGLVALATGAVELEEVRSIVSRLPVDGIPGVEAPLAPATDGDE